MIYCGMNDVAFRCVQLFMTFDSDRLLIEMLILLLSRYSKVAGFYSFLHQAVVGSRVSLSLR